MPNACAWLLSFCWQADLVWRVGNVPHLVGNVSKQVIQALADVGPSDTDVLSLCRKAPPTSGLARRFFVEQAHERLIESFPFRLSEAPLVPIDNVQVLVLVQLSLGGDVFDLQTGQIIRVQRRLPQHMLQRDHHRRWPLLTMSVAMTSTCRCRCSLFTLCSSRDIECSTGPS